jgi:nucleotide-binding universal stress UspA family protein
VNDLGTVLALGIVFAHFDLWLAFFGAATAKFDLLIVGFMGHSALYNRLIGSTTDRLVELAPCKILVVK